MTLITTETSLYPQSQVKYFAGLHWSRLKSVFDERLCATQIAPQRIIVEQSIEWNSSLYVNFIDFEKVFGSVEHKLIAMFRRLSYVP